MPRPSVSRLGLYRGRSGGNRAGGSLEAMLLRDIWGYMGSTDREPPHSSSGTSPFRCRGALPDFLVGVLDVLAHQELGARALAKHHGAHDLAVLCAVEPHQR